MTMFTVAAETKGAARWLAQAVDEELGVGERHYVLAAAQLCRAIEPSTEDVLLPRIDDLLTKPDDLGFPSVDLTSGVLGAALVAGVGPPAARDAASSYAAMLRSVAPDEPQDATGVAVHLFFDLPLRPTPTAGLGDLDLRRLLPGNRESLAGALDLVEARTWFGQRRPDRVAPLAAILDGVVLDCLSRYDLAAGARALRARRYVHPHRSLAVDDSLAFLLATGQEDGSFGDYDTAIARMEKRGMEAGAAVRLRATVLLQILWTLAVWSDLGWSLHEHGVSEELRAAAHGALRC